MVGPPTSPAPVVSTTTVTLISGGLLGPSSVSAGQPLAVVASVRPPPGSAVIPTGTADFSEGTTLVAALLLDARGQAVLSLPALAAGSYQFTMIYGGNSQTGASFGTVAAASLVNTPPIDLILQRIGNRTTPTKLVFTFNEPLNPSTATDPANHRLTSASGGRIGSLAATSNNAARSVRSLRRNGSTSTPSTA